MADRVLIVGAGPAGLAAAAELRELGIPAQVLERTEAVATSWRSRYDRLRLNTCRWNSKLRPEASFKRGVPFFPVRDDAVRYLESFAAEYEIDVRFGVTVERIEPAPNGEGWLVSTSEGSLPARQVVVATGEQNQNTPWLPDWPDRDQFPGEILHSVEYRNPQRFQDRDVLVIGSGCSGLDIARDLAQGGARTVKLSARTQRNVLSKLALGLPTDVLIMALWHVPTWLGDAVMRLAQRVSVGDLSRWGLPGRGTGIITDEVNDGVGPVIVDPGVIKAIKAGDFEVVPAVSTVGAHGVTLADGTNLQPDVIIAATGFTTGLEAVVGHLGVLTASGMPLEYEGAAVRPGLRFVGYSPCMGVIGRDARRVIRDLYREMTGEAPPGPPPGIVPDLIREFRDARRKRFGTRRDLAA